MNRPRNNLLPSLLLLLSALLLGGIALLALRRAAPYAQASATAPGLAGGLLLDAVRDTFAEKSFDTADLYFHRGRGHHARAEAFTNCWFQRLQDSVSPRVVLHREGADVNEVLPWLWLSTKLGSTSNLTYVLTAAYWLRAAGHLRAAGSLLEETQRHQGPQAALFLEQARIALARRQRGEARRFLDQGIQWAAAAPPPSELTDDRDVRNMLRLCRAYLFEYEGDTNAASRLYAILFDELPTHPAALRQRHLDLQAGRPVSPTAAEALHTMSRANIHCDEDHDHDDHDNHDHEDPDGS